MGGKILLVTLLCSFKKILEGEERMGREGKGSNGHFTKERERREGDAGAGV